MRKILFVVTLLLPVFVAAQKRAATTTHYPNGNVVENAAAKTDTILLCGKWTAIGRTENGMKEGWWEFYNGRSLAYSGTYRKGVKQGEWKGEDPHAKFNYKDGKPDGEILYYHLNSIAIEQRRHYVAGKAHGDWITYAEDGKTQTEIRRYNNDKPVGVWKIRQGELMYTGGTNDFGYHGRWNTMINDTVVGGGNYVNGVQEGEWTEVHYRGDKSVGRYVNGKKEGLWRWYSEDHLVISREFVNGKRHGADTSWDKGQIDYILHWYEDRLDGSCVHFHPNGNKESEHIYDRVTRAASFRSFDENGNLLITGQLEINPDYLILEADREGDCRVAVYPDHELELIEQGLCFWSCHASLYGKPEVDVDSVARYLRSEQFRKDTMGPHAPWNTPMYFRTGVWTEYYPGKKKKEEGMYEKRPKNDLITGETTYFKTGWWNVYGEDGTVLREELYEHGELVETRNRKK